MIDLSWIASRIDAAKELVIDTETTGLDWKNDRTVGYVLTFSGNPADSHYLPIRHGGGGNLDPDKTLAMLRRHLSRPDLRTIGFSYSFDLKFMHRDDVEIRGPLEDAQINAYLIDENQRSFTLEACCIAMKVQEKKGEELYKRLAGRFGGTPDRKQMQHYWKLAGDDAVAVDYAVGDGTSTWQLRDAQLPEIASQNLTGIWEIENRCIRVLHRMMVRGVRIDEERLDQVRRMIKQRMEQARRRLPPGFNENAPTQLKQIFTDASLTNWPMTAPSKMHPNGIPSFAEHWLLTTPLGRDIVTVRKLSHLENAFLRPMAERHLWNGRVHTSYNQTRGEQYGTVTGRLSSSDPNLQQVNKRDPILGSLFRSIFIPEEGHVWGSPDYSQIEPRLLAHFAQVKVLIEGYMSDPPIDAHSAVALAANIPRQAGKQLNQALLTGCGRRKAALMLNRPQAEADQIVNDYFEAMPELNKNSPAVPGNGGFQSYATGVMEQRGYIKSLMGRRSREPNPNFAYRALNRILQTSNADILKRSMAEIDEYLMAQGDTTFLLNNVHDSLDFSYHPDNQQVYQRALVMMTEDYGPGQKFDLTVPLALEVDEGANWAEASYGLGQVRDAFREMGSDYDRVRGAVQMPQATPVAASLVQGGTLAAISIAATPLMQRTATGEAV
jgi:DNA polymerase-1